MTDLVRKEREHLDVLERRLAHLHDDRPERRGDPAYPPGEAMALAWVLAVVRGLDEPIALRVERLEKTMRQLVTKVGRIEHELEDDEP
jgi:hypothetical protein